MRDFAQQAVACGVEGFEAAYAANRMNAIQVMLAHAPIAQGLQALLANRERWTGTMQRLLDIVGPVTGIRNTRKLSTDPASTGDAAAIGGHPG